MRKACDYFGGGAAAQSDMSRHRLWLWVREDRRRSNFGGKEWEWHFEGSRMVGNAATTIVKDIVDEQ